MHCFILTLLHKFTLVPTTAQIKLLIKYKRQRFTTSYSISCLLVPSDNIMFEPIYNMFFVEGEKNWWRQTFLHHDFEHFWSLKVLSHFTHPPHFSILFEASCFLQSCWQIARVLSGEENGRSRARIHLRSPLNIITSRALKHICKTSPVLAILFKQCILVICLSSALKDKRGGEWK